MLRSSWQHIRHTPGRSAALSAGIMVAAASFSLLTSAVTTGRAEVQGRTEGTLHPVYDLLVRPTGAVNSVEQSGGLVTDNYLAGVFGGISRGQYDQVAKTAGVQVAAPIAVVGYVMETVTLPVDVTDLLAGPGEKLLRISTVHRGDRGTSVYPPDGAAYVYATDRPVTSLTSKTAGTVVTPGSVPPTGAPGGTWTGPSICVGSVADPGAVGRPGLPQLCFPKAAAKQTGSALQWSFPALVAAIDPVAEQKLDGLDAAMVGGRALTAADNASDAGAKQVTIPVVAASRPYLDDQMDVTVESLDPAKVSAEAGRLTPDQLRDAVIGPPGAALRKSTITAQQAYDTMLSAMSGQQSSGTGCCLVDAFWTSKPVGYTVDGPKELTATEAANPDSIWSSQVMGSRSVVAPTGAADVGFRTVTEYPASNGAQLRLTKLTSVGVFDPQRIAGYDPAGATPLQIFSPPSAKGADAASAKALGGQPLLPGGSPTGYLQQTPTLLTTLDAVSAFGGSEFPDADQSAPISAIRVKVAGLHGGIRERLDQIAQVAYRIRQATGLSVDIVAGASPTPVTVNLPAGKYGRPALRIDEGWMRQGAALVVLDAVDRKSLILFILILATTALFLGNGVHAAVRSRARTIGVLRALGWSRTAVFRMILGEVAVLGALAGLAGTGLSSAIIALFSLKIPPDRVLLVTPVAVALAVLAGIGPAWRAAQGSPMDVLRIHGRTGRRARSVSGVVGFALVHARRSRGRLQTGALALAIGVAAVTVLLAVNRSFGADAGDTVLADVAGTQVRGVDLLSAGLAVLLGAVSVADAVYLGLRERADEIAVLRATGWRESHIVRACLVEGVVTALVGGAIGAAAGIAVGADIGDALLAALGGVLVVAVVVRLTLAAVRRTPLTAALAEEE